MLGINAAKKVRLTEKQNKKKNMGWFEVNWASTPRGLQ
jgi:hypothetical protein